MKLIEKNYYLNCAAKDGYRSYLQAYASHHQREIFDVNQLDLAAIAKSFGLAVPPRVDLAVKVSGAKARENKYKGGKSLGKRDGDKKYYSKGYTQNDHTKS